MLNYLLFIRMIQNAIQFICQLQEIHIIFVHHRNDRVLEGFHVERTLIRSVRF